MPEAFEAVSIGTIGKNSVDEVRISLSQYKGHVLCDVRVYSAFTAAKVPMATKKGVSVKIEALPELARLLAEAESKARELGLLPTGGGEDGAQ